MYVVAAGQMSRSYTSIQCRVTPGSQLHSTLHTQIQYPARCRLGQSWAKPNALSVLDMFVIICREQKLSKEHNIAANRLNDWKKRFLASLDETRKVVGEFKSKDRMSEAEQYVFTLNEIGKKLEDYNLEVRKTLKTVWILASRYRELFSKMSDATKDTSRKIAEKGQELPRMISLT